MLSFLADESEENEEREDVKREPTGPALPDWGGSQDVLWQPTAWQD